MDFIDSNIQEYVSLFSDSEPELLKNLRRETYLKTMHPYMISGDYQGRFLSFISSMICPKFIVEIGTFTGYATLCMAEGLDPKPESTIVTIDHNEDISYLAKKYFELSDYNNQIDFRISDALQEIESITDKIDLVFIDADKHNYLNYYQKLVPKMRKGGIILADNVLWYGKVTDENVDPKDIDTVALKEFNKFVKEDERVSVMMLPIRDGISLIKVL